MHCATGTTTTTTYMYCSVVTSLVYYCIRVQKLRVTVHREKRMRPIAEALERHFTSHSPYFLDAKVCVSVNITLLPNAVCLSLMHFLSEDSSNPAPETHWLYYSIAEQS